MIVEGMDYDNTRQNYVTYDEERDIPLNITLLNTRFPKYQLSLVGRINVAGDLESIALGVRVECNIGYDALGKPESPQTIMIDDGRVFTQLWPVGSLHTLKSRVHRMIDDVKTAGGFELAYLQIQNDPGRFYSGVAEIKGGVVTFIPTKKRK